MNKIEVPCPICDCPPERQYYKVLYPDTLGSSPVTFGYDSSASQMKSFRIVKCNICNHGFSSPIYENLYENYIDVEDKYYLKTAEVRKKTAQKVLHKIHKYKQHGSLLDFGCSTGEFLEESKKYFDSEGVELSNWAREHCIRKNIDVYNALPEKKYDIITMFGVVEHLEDPKSTLKEIYEHLNSDGIVVIWTGNLDSYVSKALGSKWYYIQGQHIQYFTDFSLSKLMGKVGFERKYSGIYPYVMNLGYIGKSIERYPILNILGNILKSNFIKDIELTLLIPCEMFVIYKKIN